MYRHVVRWGLFRDRVVLEVADSGVYKTVGDVYALHSPWREATDEDLRVIEAEKAYQESLQDSDRHIPAGSRVEVRTGSFNHGAKGTVVFQEPRGGCVWVWRDGSSAPCYYWNHELHILNYKDATNPRREDIALKALEEIARDRFGVSYAETYALSLERRDIARTALAELK